MRNLKVKLFGNLNLDRNQCFWLVFFSIALLHSELEIRVMKLVNDKGRLWIIDGGTGTWIEQKKGNTDNMEEAWSALSALTDAEVQLHFIN